jgi:hypothetical protein
MKKVIISFICAVALLSACEKVSLKDPTLNPISVVTPADTTKVKPPATTPPTTTPPATTPPVTTPPVTTPPVTTPPVTTPPVTTPPVAVAISFSKDVIPVLNMCENCHSHGWSPSSVASTYYSNLVSKGYVIAATYTSSKIYSKLSSGHPGSGSISTVNTNKIIDWMKAGSLNN